MDRNDILIHLAELRENYYNAVSPPIIQSSNFVFNDIDALRDSIQDEFNNHIYTRGNNPTVNILRKKLAALEQAEDALITGSGASAIAIAVMSNIKSGEHAIVVNHPYSWTSQLFGNLLSRYNVEYSLVDATNIDHIREAIKDNTKLLYLESPNSISYEIQDLKACATLAKANDLITIIDNSYSSPIFQNPISLGIDLVVHSATKYINGHSDVVCGVVCGSTKMIRQIFQREYMTLGTIIAPNDASLVIRGLRTLEMRMHHIQQTTNKIIDFLDGHPKVKTILYPFHKDFPQQTLAKSQMSGCTGLFSIVLDVDDKSQVHSFINQLKAFQIAVSWGGHESLCLPFLAFHDIPGKDDHYISWKLIRLSVGFESADYLINDLDQALLAIQ